MPRRYYKSRVSPEELSAQDLLTRIGALYEWLKSRDYFKEKAGVGQRDSNSPMEQEALIFLGFQPFPLEEWNTGYRSEEEVFSLIEFLFDRVSKPGPPTNFTTETGWHYEDYGSYDDKAAREEMRETVDVLLADVKPGYELSEQGIVQLIGSDGLEHILKAGIPHFDPVNVDRKVGLAVSKWQNRHRNLHEMHEAVRLLADVFEYLKKNGDLRRALLSQDSSDLFNIANNFSIRHHNGNQKSAYDPAIWYAWMFHFYLATYHASIRLILKTRTR